LLPLFAFGLFPFGCRLRTGREGAYCRAEAAAEAHFKDTNFFQAYWKLEDDEEEKTKKAQEKLGKGSEKRLPGGGGESGPSGNCRK